MNARYRWLGLPEALSGRHYDKMFCDPFDYAVGLRSGEVLFVHEATIVGLGWVHLTVSGWHADSDKGFHDLPLERGIDVRASEIAWVADAPFGS